MATTKVEPPHASVVVLNHNGERYLGTCLRSLFDSDTGYPAEGPRHVTLVSEKMEDVNGVATAIMVLGAQAGQRIIESTPGLEGLIVDRDETLWLSAGLKDRLQPAVGSDPGSDPVFVGWRLWVRGLTPVVGN